MRKPPWWLSQTLQCGQFNAQAPALRPRDSLILLGRTCKVCCAMLIAYALWLFGAISAYAEPRALASVFEMAAPSGLSQPSPAGLRMVLYDNGQILTFSGPYVSSSDDEVTTGFYSPVEAAHLVTELNESLASVPRTLNTNPKMPTPGVGTTILQLWDEGRHEYSQWWAAGHPCLPASQSHLDALNSKIRDRLDGRFIRACDSLTQMRVPAAKRWTPDAIRIELRAVGAATDGTHPWPDDWFEEQPPFAQVLYACAVIGSARSELTQRIRSGATRAGTIGEHVRSVDGRNWMIWGLEYPLPGQVSYQVGGGDNLITVTIHGPCALQGKSGSE